MVNHLDYINLSSRQVEQQVKGYSLVFLKDRNNVVEWGMKLPMFVPSFYKYVTKNSYIPSQEEFYGRYVNDNKEWFEKRDDSESILKGIKARAYRSYPSIVRDIHFALVVKERSGFDSVIYNYDTDIKDGIDLVIRNKGYSLSANSHVTKTYAVNLFTKTERAYMGRENKGSRHKKIPNVEYIDMPVSFKGSKRCGYFYLYHDRELNMLRGYIE